MNKSEVYFNNTSRSRAIKAGARYENVSRSAVYERDNGICHICGKPVDPDDWHADHIVPFIAGGAHEFSNVAVSHPHCNRVKGGVETAQRPDREPGMTTTLGVRISDADAAELEAIINDRGPMFNFNRSDAVRWLIRRSAEQRKAQK